MFFVALVVIVIVMHLRNNMIKNEDVVSYKFYNNNNNYNKTITVLYDFTWFSSYNSNFIVIIIIIIIVIIIIVVLLSYSNEDQERATERAIGNKQRHCNALCVCDNCYTINKENISEKTNFTNIISRYCFCFYSFLSSSSFSSLLFLFSSVQCHFAWMGGKV